MSPSQMDLSTPVCVMVSVCDQTWPRHQVFESIFEDYLQYSDEEFVELTVDDYKHWEPGHKIKKWI